MGRKRTPGLQLRKGVWHIDKVVYGQRVVESTRTSDLYEAERYLAHRIETIRQSTVYGVRPTRLFGDAAAKYLRENLHKRSIGDDASRLKRLLPYIGTLPLQHIHDGTLAPYVNACRKKGLKTKTINNGIEVVRRLLNLAARKWRDEHGLTWLETPPLLSMVEVTDARQPYPLGWDEQKYLLKALPDHLATMALFKVNTGCREQEVCQLRWDWEVDVPELETSVFLIPSTIVKNKEDRLVVLNDVAKSVIDAERGKHETHVFTYRGNPVTRIYNSGWKLARHKAAAQYAKDHGEEITWGFANLRVHDLKHTFGRRLRAAGVQLETRKVLLGHRNGDITSHYSAPEIEELLEAANRVCAVQSRKSHALTLLKRKTA
ncbi:MAG: tyrosine-type recombinase/integrase [Chromatiaceae bacterium]|nr:tyrosine-type recombinase/integrase [Chromatiaceae bacterium]